MPFTSLSPREATYKLGKIMSQLTGSTSPTAPRVGTLEIAPWAESSSDTLRSSGASMPDAIMADKAAFITGQHYLIFDDPWLPTFPESLAERRASVPVSPKTMPLELDARGLASQTDGKVHTRFSPVENVKPTDITDIHGRPMSATTLSEGLTADLRSFLLMRRWFAIHQTETDKQQSNLDTRNCDMIDHIMDLETRYRSMLSGQGMDSDMSPSDFYNKQKAIRTVFEELAKVRKQRVGVLAEKKRLDERFEGASKYLEGERAKLFERLDAAFEIEGLLPAPGLMPPTPPTGSSQEVPVMLDNSDDEDYETTDEDHECTCEACSEGSQDGIASDAEDSFAQEPKVRFDEKIVAWRDKAVAKSPEAVEEMQHRAAKLAVSQMDEALKCKYRHS